MLLKAAVLVVLLSPKIVSSGQQRMNSQNSSLVITRLGSLRGVVQDELNLRYFKGVPYAQPPVQELRWQPPVPRQPWLPAVLQADTHKDNCAQHIDTPPWATMKINGWSVIARPALPRRRHFYISSSLVHAARRRVQLHAGDVL